MHRQHGHLYYFALMRADVSRSLFLSKLAQSGSTFVFLLLRPWSGLHDDSVWAVCRPPKIVRFSLPADCAMQMILWLPGHAAERNDNLNYFLLRPDMANMDKATVLVREVRAKPA